jgi:hypothetical protein
LAPDSRQDRHRHGVETKVRKVLAMAILALSLGACADGQGVYASAASSHFAPGATTRAQAIAELGPPSSIYDQADGSRTLSWARNGGLFAESETRSLSIQFGPDDKMIRVIPDASPAR